MPREIKLIPVPVVVGVVSRDGRLLISERPEGKPYPGYWEFPGGKIEPNEDGLMALVRELHEEIGIEVTSARHCFDHVYHYPDRTVHLAVWIVDAFNGEPSSLENQKLRWSTFSEMQQLNLLDGMWPLLPKISPYFI